MGLPHHFLGDPYYSEESCWNWESDGSWVMVGKCVFFTTLAANRELFQADNTFKISSWSIACIRSMVNGTWREDLLQIIFYLRDIEVIWKIPICTGGGADTWVWHYTTRGRFTVSSAYKVGLAKALEQLPSYSYPCSEWRLIWNCKNLPKVKLFAWQLCHNSLATCSNLIYRKICTFGRCLRCFAEVEDDHHLFLHCSYAMEGWLKIDFFPYQLLPKATSWLHLFRLISDYGPKESNNLDRFVMGLWGLWIARNRLVFFEEWNGGKRCNGGTTFPHILHRCTKPSWEGSKVQARSPILLVTSGDGIKLLTSLKLGELLTNSTTH